MTTHSRLGAYSKELVDQRNMITGAVFSFLLLQDRIIHVDVVEHSGQIFMPQ